MRKILPTALSAIALLVPRLAQASEEGYAGAYQAGYAHGQFVAQFVPYVLAAVAVVVVWFGLRAWKVRRDRKRGPFKPSSRRDA